MMNSDGRSANRWGWFLLWGLRDRRLDLALTLITTALLLWSRAGLMASGPWEWDETIFARGMLHFELAAHFPQPPGFPGLLALGHLLWPLAGTPLKALQFVSAIASVAALWPLSLLGRRVAPPAVATAAALFVLFLPAPWLYSVRGFSTWPALTLALIAAAVLSGGLDGRRVTTFTLLVTAAFLVRPILAPGLGLLWLAGINTVKPLKRVLPGLVLGTVLVAVAVAAMVHLEGGWDAFIAPFSSHGEHHTDRLYRNPATTLGDSGLARGVGGAAVRWAMLSASLAGLVVWWRRVGPRAALTWLAVLGVSAAQLLFIQNRTIVRYGVGVQVPTAPLLAGAAALAPAPLAAAGLMGLTGAAAWASLPLMKEQHRETLGAWQATVDAFELAGAREWAVVVEPEVHVFSSYQWYLMEADGRSTPPMVLSPRAPEPWLGVRRPWLVATVHPHLYMPSLIGEYRIYRSVSDRLAPLSRNRFPSAELIANPPLPVGTWWTREHRPDGTSFMWAGPEAELWLPPVPAGTQLGLVLRPAPGEAPLQVSVEPGGVAMELDGFGGTARLWTRLETDSSSAPIIVRLFRRTGYPPGDDDDRPLSAQLLAVEMRPPGTPFGGPVVTDIDRWRLRLEVDGAYQPEDFGELGRGVWLEPSARLRLAVDEPGQLTLRLASPRPIPANLRFGVAGLEVGWGGLTSGESLVSMFLPSAHITDGWAEIELLSDAYIPSETGSGTDTRRLGVVLLGLDFEPAHPTTGWWNDSIQPGG